MSNKTSFLLLLFLSLSLFLHVNKALKEDASGLEPVVRKDERRQLVVTEYGEVSAIEIGDGARGQYHLQFISLDPNSLFLPVLLHADMVFYVHTGSGRLTWTDTLGEMRRVDLRRGDIYRLKSGSIFYVHSSLQPERLKLRIYAIFTNTDDDLYEPTIGAYSTIGNLLRSFDKEVLKAAFKVSEDLIRKITKGTQPPGIVHAEPTKETETNFWELDDLLLQVFRRGRGGMLCGDNKKKPYNIFDEKPDFENSNGWSLTVTKKNLHLLKGSNIGLFMVNLTKGSMMGPHWNPLATEISIVLRGEGMVRLVCSSTAKKSECNNMRFRVEEGDVFAVPKFHPMAQISFNNESFVFMGFSTTRRKINPQFLAGKSSVFQTLDKRVLALSFNVTNSTVIDQLMNQQPESVILECCNCAEEEQRLMEEKEAKKREEEKEREEEEKKREEKEREEEEARKREKEEAKREEEEAREEERKEEEKEREAEAKREKEEARKREEDAKWEQEEAKGEEEERRRRWEEERKKEAREEPMREKREREHKEEETWRREHTREREEDAKREQEEPTRKEEERRGQEEPERETTRKEREEVEEKKRRQEAAEWEEEEARREEEEEWGEALGNGEEQAMMI
ncbi:vicilin-like seed storage protein At2g18540 [Quercus suber]|uniref:vicilin-like seed storage protein At2g18540 n=1 Tax=Quercus suber TaxID=58331 RepID=UPI0032DE6826